MNMLIVSEADDSLLNFEEKKTKYFDELKNLDIKNNLIF